MKYLFINSVYGVRSTGKIIADECHRLQKEGHECAVAYGRETIDDPTVRQIQIGSKKDYMIHAAMSRVFDLHGFCSKNATRELLRSIEEFRPDVIWIHNLHGYYINVEELFAWLKKQTDVNVFWTLHDCWSFTGHCAYFTMVGCEKWKKGCHHCKQLSAYPKTFLLDNSKNNYKKKRETFVGVNNLTLITPSKWLANLTRESFLSEYPVQVIHNTINTDIFRPTESDFRQKHGLNDKKLVLGVAVGWEETKGLPDILELRKILPKEYEIVLVGTTTEQIQILPKGILGIQRTANQKELAEIYTASDVFINPTHQDNYPTVNLEAVACGTPVITYNVGGSPESAFPENVVDEGDIGAMRNRIIEICEGFKGMNTCNE